LRGDTRSDLRLETGDVVLVALRGARVDVTGAVVRPAIYEVKSGETLADVLRAAGGFLPDAELRRVTIHRLLPAAERGPGSPPRAVIDVALTANPPASFPIPRSPGGAGGGASASVGHATPPAAASVSGVLIPPLSLLDGDSIVIDYVRGLTEQPFVTISGMVNKPGAYAWQEGMTLRDLMSLSRGPKLGADLREAEIARLPPERLDGQLASTVRVPLDSSYLLERDSSGQYLGAPGVAFPPAGSAPEVVLQPFDNLLIFRQPDFQLQRTVTLTGEVRFPGTYALQSKDERLSALIDRAGGLTSDAYPGGVRFYRAVNNAGRINVNLERAVARENSNEDIILQPGDSIDIPEYLPSVKVAGAVNSPGSVMYRPGAGLDYYLNAAGGYAQRADHRHVSVRFANGEIRTRSKWLVFSSAPEPGPGSEVFVPLKDPSERTDYVSLFGAIAQLLASTLAIIVVVTR
jgi:protein involved in polysaccharide export with SLBB domain